jgi:hypothetical protein
MAELYRPSPAILRWRKLAGIERGGAPILHVELAKDANEMAFDRL